MINVVLIGQGNLATHLWNVFHEVKTIELLQVNSRKLATIPPSDVSIIAVSDDAIQEVSECLGDREGLIVHTSGTVPMQAIQQQRKGVFYPLQSFTKGSTVDFTTIPFCLETEYENDFLSLTSLATLVGANTYHLDSAQRKKIHLAAVFVNNFTNHMYAVGKDICDAHQVPFDILYPLIAETAKKITTIAPKEAQTGPAKRNDEETIKTHLEQLNSQQKELYTLLTKAIQNH